ncbi:MAG: DUF4423 domain-containing protein [Bdellovibrionales bacterium]
MELEKFRAYLQKEYLEIRDRNPGFSLRAYARKLKVDPGSLSQFLNGHRAYSLKKVQQLALQIGLDRKQLANLFTTNPELNFIEFDRLHLLSKWYYVAILECLALDGFQPSPKWISEKIGLSLSIVSVAINQLFTEGVLTLKNDGSWQNNWGEYSTQQNENIDELPLRNHQKQLLQLAAESIDNNDPLKKSHTAYVSAIDSQLIPEIKDEIAKFRRKMAKLINEKSKKKDSIYCLQINLFSELNEKSTNTINKILPKKLNNQ